MKTLTINFRKTILAVVCAILISSSGFAINGHVAGPVKSKMPSTPLSYTGKSKTQVRSCDLNQEVVNYMASKGMEVLTAVPAGGSGKWIVTAIDVHNLTPKIACSIVTIMIDIGG